MKATHWWAVFINLQGGSNMDARQLAKIIQQRLGLDDQDLPFSIASPAPFFDAKYPLTRKKSPPIVAPSEGNT
jgi:hypothetical protein